MNIEHNGFSGRCSFCKFFQFVDLPKSDPFYNDGICNNPLCEKDHEFLKPHGSKQASCSKAELRDDLQSEYQLKMEF